MRRTDVRGQGYAARRQNIKNILKYTLLKKENKTMQKKFKVEVDCANCAAKMEDAAAKVDGVNSVTISFMTQKMVLDAPDDRYDSVLKNVVKTCKKVDSDFEIQM